MMMMIIVIMTALVTNQHFLVQDVLPEISSKLEVYHQNHDSSWLSFRGSLDSLNNIWPPVPASARKLGVRSSLPNSEPYLCQSWCQRREIVPTESIQRCSFLSIGT